MGVEPLLRLAKLSGDPLYRHGRRNDFLYRQLAVPSARKASGTVLIHAFAQNIGRYWGPNYDGQVDSGMSNGNGLAAIEAGWAGSGKAQGSMSNAAGKQKPRDVCPEAA